MAIIRTKNPRAQREAAKGRVAMMCWMDTDLRDWVKVAAQKDYRGNATMWLEHLIKKEKARVRNEPLIRKG